MQGNDWPKEVRTIYFGKPSCGADRHIQYSQMTIQSDDNVQAMINTRDQNSSALL